LMKHWLTLFLSNQTIEDARGERNLMRMQAQISDTLNNGLFPGSKPRIKNVLFKEFAIQ
jgi:flagellar basal body-associated protein FliL